MAATGVLTTLDRVVGNLPGATPAVRQLFGQRLRSADGVTWAPVGGGVALPHLRVPVALGRDAGTLALLFLREALSLKESPPDDVPVTRLLFFVAPSPRAHLELLAQLSRALARSELRRLVMQGAPDEQVFAALAESEAANLAKEAKA